MSHVTASSNGLMLSDNNVLFRVSSKFLKIFECVVPFFIRLALR